MTYTAPQKDMLFTLEHVANANQILADIHSEIDFDTIAGVMDEAAKLTQDVIAPLNRLGDLEPSFLKDGKVTTTAGFKNAFDQYTQGGWQGLSHPEDVGGQNLPKLLATACMEMLNSANLSFALCSLLTDGSIEALLTAGSEEQKQLFIPRMISGQWTGSMNLTEPQAGSDLALVRTRAEPQADGTYKVFGTKIFITYGDHDLAENIIHLVLARTPSAPEDIKGISLFIVPKVNVNPDGSLGAPNDVQCLSLEHKLGIKASPTAVLQFGDNGGATGYLIGEENRGLEYMFIMMNAARFAVGIQGLSVMERSYQHALSYARERLQSRPVDGSAREAVAIIHHPDVKRMLLTMKSTIEACRAMAYHAAGLSDIAHHHADAEVRAAALAQYEFMVPLVKGYSTEQSIDVTSLGVQIHGGMGFIEETGAAQYYRDARILPIYEGTTAIQANDLIGRKTLRDGGAVALSFADQIGLTVSELNQSGNASLTAIATSLSAANAAYRSVVAHVLAHTKSNPNNVFAGSVPYLKLAGLTISAWHSARAALAAQAQLDAGNNDGEFMTAKIQTALFYAQHLLPQASAIASSITEGGEAVAQFDVSGFYS
ncbi:acyl-CoA dehydrogenase [Formosimonas limnophila]|uniref:3-methylmercaptopropionyl-CoA dehydrogenase n=1 Tax=Formosimonas limnophila TaxID=1384487 RepID=A0A8J3CMK3_9BURK|nr:acyl-CoA dehydrogenase [Formosimonas limnophila]GHA70825.1 acyl-CoA dehydrogenase [Formosimonas limnophila]